MVGWGVDLGVMLSWVRRDQAWEREATSRNNMERVTRFGLDVESSEVARKDGTVRPERRRGRRWWDDDGDDDGTGIWLFVCVLLWCDMRSMI